MDMSEESVIKDEEGNPIDQAVIMAMDTSGYSIGSYGFPDQLGNYTVRQLTTSMYGAYATASFGENNVYLSQWYDKASEKDSAKFFQVYQGYDTPNINFVLEKGGSISGRAVDKFENGIAGVSVDVLDSLFNQKSYAITNDSGYYLAGGLSTGEYFIRISNYEYIEQWYNGAASYENATKVSVVVKQNTPNINFILSSGASISGTVKDKRNSGLPYASVTIVDSTYLPTNFSSADNAGKYYTPKLQGNKTYYVMAQNYGYTSQWYNLVSTSDSATPIILQPEERRENIDFILSMEGGAISGGVSNNNGNPLANIYVNIMDSIGNTISQGYTDYYGKYEVKNISSGKYYAKATDFNYLYEDQWYDHKYSKFEADPIYVFEDAVTENINFNLFKVGEIKSDSILIKLELVNIPDTLTFSQAHVSDYTVDYWWGIKFDVDGLSSTGTNGYEIEVALIHFKQPGELPFKSNLIDGTYAQLIEWNANYGEVRHQNFNVWIDESNKNILTISVPKFWAELRNVNTNTKYFAHTSHLASNGGFQDFTSSSYGGAPITDAIGDVSYDFIDLVSTSWEIKLLVLAENEEEIPKDYSLSQNYPNPFNPCTRISWQSPVSSWQTIKVYDVLGNEVAALVDEYRDAGGYTIEFNASNLASGIYLYRIQAGKFVETKKMILIK